MTVCCNASELGAHPPGLPTCYRHDGLKKDGTEDKRVSSEHGLGADRERASELGKQGGKASGGGEQGETYKPSEHDGLKKNGEPDKRVSSESGVVLFAVCPASLTTVSYSLLQASTASATTLSVPASLASREASSDYI